MTNPYAPPMAAVRDIADPSARLVAADRGTRLGAAIVDSLVFFAMVYLPFLLVAIIAGATTESSDDPRAGAIMLGGGLLALVGFIAWCWLTIGHMRNGQSIAKKMLGIKVVRSDGSPISLARFIWLRNVVNWVINIVPMYGLIDSLFIFGESRQCLHDKLADTIVVNA